MAVALEGTMSPRPVSRRLATLILIAAAFGGAPANAAGRRNPAPRSPYKRVRGVPAAEVAALAARGPKNFREAVILLKAHRGSAQDKADAFDGEMRRSIRKNMPYWSARRRIGTDGSHVFVSDSGEGLVIDLKGKLWRGHASADGLRARGRKHYEVDYSHLREL